MDNNVLLTVNEKKQKSLIEFLLLNTRLTHEALADMLNVSADHLAKVVNGAGKLDEKTHSLLLEYFYVFIEG